ncbi:c-type cytochrome [Methylobacterium aquaticum]|jgi:cytochrome c|uniref:c-type cytochrome n=1 Tax=Methylobacterium aquaticum TaxID=270351 RepID=UPI003D184AD6
MPIARRLALATLACCLAVTARAEAPMRGHGGPVRALAVTADGTRALSGSFDASAILWSVEDGAALRVLRSHDGAVNAVALLPDGGLVTGGEDGRIALWRDGSEPERIVATHAGPISGLAVAPDGRRIASSSWDGTARITPLDGGPALVRTGHQGNVNGVAFLPDGRLVTAGYDATVRIWPEVGPAVTVPFDTPVNAVVAAPDGEIAAAGADGTLSLLRPDGGLRARLEVGPRPVVALALSPDGRTLAAATVGGAVAIVDRAGAQVRLTLVGPGLPVWSLAFRGDDELVTGGGDRLVRLWNLRTGEPIGPLAMARPADALAAYAGDRGAEVFRACEACHTLTPEGGNRAGPTLHGVFGRRIATVPDYPYSPAFRRLDIVWTPETVARLFEIGPARFTPGTKMPEQTITTAEDRAALVRFLERATR